MSDVTLQQLALWLMCTMASWRVTLLVTVDEGPFSVNQWVRSKIDPMRKTWYGRGIRCEICVSFWVCLATALALYFMGKIAWGPDVVLWWLSMSSGVILANSAAQ